jgi:hypothetical protein
MAAGRMWFAYEDATTRARDAVIATGRLRRDTEAVTIARPAAGGWRVQILLRTARGIAVAHEAEVRLGAPPVVAHVDPPQRPDDEALAMLRAVDTATRATIDEQMLRCADRFEPAVLPARIVGKQGWLVYLAAVPADPAERPLGGHHRLHVSADGGEVLGAYVFGRECLAVRREPDVTPIVPYMTAAVPEELHVYSTLRHKEPLMVSTLRGVWRVENGDVRYVAEPR